MNWDNQIITNKEHEQNPQPGDYWHERFSPYFIVVEYDKENDLVYYADEVIWTRDNGAFTFDFSRVKRKSRMQLFTRVHYNSEEPKDNYVADCYPKPKANLQEWISLGRPFIDASEKTLDKLIFLS